MENLRSRVVIVTGETGSGKSTRIPQLLSEFGTVAVSQPRRLAACALARRVADETNTKLGDKVGYSVRFDEKSSKNTRIKYLTEGMLLKELLHGVEYDTIMLDEAHERTLNFDVLLGLVKKSKSRLVISSATMDLVKFKRYLKTAKVIELGGKKFPVKVNFARQPVLDLVEACVSVIMKIHFEFESGDILVFLSGQDVIKQCAARLPNDVEVLMLYSQLPEHEQRLVFTNSVRRRVILSTNIAETSITLPGVKYVVDSGKEKHVSFNGVEALVEGWCSQASAMQRTGRAGRVSEGTCFRLYTEKEFEIFPKQNLPELLRSNLSSVALMLMSFNEDILMFDFIDKPKTKNCVSAMQSLYALGAVNSSFQLTKLGRILAEFPLDPKLAKCIMSASEKCYEDVCAVGAMLGEMGNLFVGKCDFNNEQGDHYMLLDVYNRAKASNFSFAFCNQHKINQKALQRARHVSNQLINLYKRLNQLYKFEQFDNLKDAFLQGYALNIARASQQNYMVLRDTVYVHPSSTLFKMPQAKKILFHELIVTSKEYMRGCMVVES